MWNAESLSRVQIREFLKSSEPIDFAGCGRNEKYAGWSAQRCGELGKRERGVVRAYVEKVTGMRASQGAAVHHLRWSSGGPAEETGQKSISLVNLGRTVSFLNRSNLRWLRHGPNPTSM